MAKKPPKTSLGFQDDPILATPGPLRDRLLAQMAKMGAKDVRYNVIYGKTAGGTDLRELDSLIDAAKAHGMRVQATLMSDPRYLKPTQGLTYANNDPKMWAQFARNVATREKGRIGRYSVGNEMNHSAFSTGADEDPRNAGRRYRNVYRAGYDAIKQTDRGAQVLAGELTSGGGAARDFLKGFLGGKRINTAGLAYHPYENGHTGWNINQLDDLQKTLGRYKRQGKLQTAAGSQAPLYVTEMGYDREMPNQAAYAAEAFRKAQRAKARQFLQYQLTDKSKVAQTAPAGYGQAPGAPQQRSRPVWDTSVGTADGDLSAYARAIGTSAKAKPAKARSKVVRRR